MANKKQIGEAKLEMLRKDARALLQQMEHLEGGLISDINRSGKESLHRYYKKDDPGLVWVTRPRSIFRVGFPFASAFRIRAALPGLWTSIPDTPT